MPDERKIIGHLFRHPIYESPEVKAPDGVVFGSMEEWNKRQQEKDAAKQLADQILDNSPPGAM